MPPLRTKLSERREITRARKAMKKAERIINSPTPEEKANLAIGKTGHELIKDNVGIPADMIEAIAQACPLRRSQRTPKMIKALQDLGHESGSSSYSWYARAEPLPLSKVVAVHTMVYPDNRWQPFDLSAAEISTVEGRPDIMGVRIGDGIFFSESYLNPDGVTGYRFMPAVPIATFAQAAE